MTSFNKAASRPYRVLLATFVSWKLFLLALSLGAYLAGDAYDTSAALAVQPHDDVIDHGSNSGPQHPGLAYHVVGLITRLASWDAIYFTSIARRGYRIEQEWAFGAGLPGVVRGLLGGE
jgi:Mannosyltransferase (PIG-V)).